MKVRLHRSCQVVVLDLEGRFTVDEDTDELDYQVIGSLEYRLSEADFDAGMNPPRPTRLHSVAKSG